MCPGGRGERTEQKEQQRQCVSVWRRGEHSPSVMSLDDIWGYFHSAEEEDTEPVGGQMCVGGGWQSSD